MQRILRLTRSVPSTLHRSRLLPRHQFQRMWYASDPIVIKVPGMGDSITEGELSSWAVGVGEQVETDGLVCEIETDKITVEINAEKSGTILEHFAQEGDTVLVGNDLYKIEPGEVEASSSSNESSPAAEEKSAPEAEKPAAAPSKPESKPEPSMQAKEEPKQQTQAPASAGASSGGARTERRVKMKKMRRRIADRLKDSQNTYAMLTTFNEIDMSGLINMRNEYKDDFLKTHGVKLGFMSPFAKAVAHCLQAQPVVNAVIDGPEMVYRDYVDISVAVASPSGLVVPVLRNVEGMSLADIERSIGEYAEKARDGSLSMEEMAGGTFTISNGGVFGSLMGTPIINPPQSAILGMHATNPRPVAIDGKVEIRPMMYVALTYDHRAIDGREAATFLVQLKRLIEDPRRMVLGL